MNRRSASALKQLHAHRCIGAGSTNGVCFVVWSSTPCLPDGLACGSYAPPPPLNVCIRQASSTPADPFLMYCLMQITSGDATAGKQQQQPPTLQQQQQPTRLVLVWLWGPRSSSCCTHRQQAQQAAGGGSSQVGLQGLGLSSHCVHPFARSTYQPRRGSRCQLRRRLLPPLWLQMLHRHSNCCTLPCSPSSDAAADALMLLLQQLLPSQPQLLSHPCHCRQQYCHLCLVVKHW
jgi:hypothetical protein